jgi:hypothetical protein
VGSFQLVVISLSEHQTNTKKNQKVSKHAQRTCIFFQSLFFYFLNFDTLFLPLMRHFRSQFPADHDYVRFLFVFNVTKLWKKIKHLFLQQFMHQRKQIFLQNNRPTYIMFKWYFCQDFSSFSLYNSTNQKCTSTTCDYCFYFKMIY